MPELISQHSADENDPYNLARFVSAQQNVYDTALAEIAAGEKRSHWMWYIFPQFAGLGSSVMSKKYAIGSVGEARAYLEHAVLGPRLIRCCKAALDVRGKSAHEIFGSPDDMKLRSSATLFASVPPSMTPRVTPRVTPGVTPRVTPGVTPGDSLFDQILTHFFNGERDVQTLRMLEISGDR